MWSAQKIAQNGLSTIREQIDTLRGLDSKTLLVRSTGSIFLMVVNRYVSFIISLSESRFQVKRNNWKCARDGTQTLEVSNVIRNINGFIKELRKMQQAIYLACDAEVAADVNLKTTKAVTLIGTLEERLKIAYCKEIGSDSITGLDCCDDYRDWLAIKNV